MPKPGASKDNAYDALAGDLLAEPRDPLAGVNPVGPVFTPLSPEEANKLMYDTPVVGHSMNPEAVNAKDLQEMLDRSDAEQKQIYDDAVKEWGEGHVIGGVMPAGRLRLWKDSPAAQEYLKNVPPDVLIHDMGDGTIIIRKAPYDSPVPVASTQDPQATAEIRWHQPGKDQPVKQTVGAYRPDYVGDHTA